jgi:hypothetical protein
VWKSEIAWMSLYFSLAVWISMSLIHAPAPETHIAVDAPKRLSSRVAVRA